MVIGIITAVKGSLYEMIHFISYEAPYWSYKSNHFLHTLLPLCVLFPSFLHHSYLPPSLLSTLKSVQVYFYKDIYSRDDIRPAISCQLVSQYSCLSVGKVVMLQYLSRIDLRCHWIMETSSFFHYQLLNSQPFNNKVPMSSSIPALLLRAKGGLNRKGRKTGSRGAGGRILSVCSTWYFLHFKTPELTRWWIMF